MNFLRPSLSLVFLGLMPCISAMMPQLPAYEKKEIVKMIIRQNPSWIPWLMERAGMQEYEFKKQFTPKMIQLLSCYISLMDPSFSLFEKKGIERLFDGSFMSMRDFPKPYLHLANGNATITVTSQANIKKPFTISNPTNEPLIDFAFSPVPGRFVGITKNCLMIWNANNGNLIKKMIFPDGGLYQIMNIKFDNHSIVLQDTNNCIFLVDTNDKTKRTIFTAPKESLFIPLICEDRYCFIVQTEKPGWIADTSSIKVITLLDIYELLLQLNFDQIELLAYIYYSAKYNHKVNLTGDSIENRHALEAFNSLPEKIKQCIQEFVILPQLSDSCVIS